MAALHEIARQYAEEIRDGIAWVIIWKTGRSWHAESVWLNQDSDTFELEDLSTATEILEQDPNAVMVNGYYCGHFGALADAIKAAAHAVRQLMDELAERFRKFRQYARKAVNTFVDSLLYRANTHPKWWHLYKHARKWRTRKKYKRLLMRQLCSRLAAG